MKDIHLNHSVQEIVRNDSITFKTIFVLCFVVCFVLALFTVFLPVQWRSWLPGSEEKSMIDGVRSAVYSFMSYLT
jgi:light-harvesting complex 1 beta chain